MKYAIKYLKMRISKDVELLVPKEVVEGEVEDGEYFSTDKEIFTYITNPILDGKYIVGDALTLDEIRTNFELTEEDFTAEEATSYYFAQNCENICLIKDGKRRAINVFDLFTDEEKALYKHTLENCIYLNQTIIDTLTSVNDLDTLKTMLREYSDKLESFEDYRTTQGVEKIVVKDGHVAGIERKETVGHPNISLNQGSDTDINSNEFTVNGLYTYLKENIIGHDKELKHIATILYLNYKSNPIYGTESILVPGPTGTGKTATFHCASQYFHVPFHNIHSSNIVPEGIVGTTLEDIFSLILDSCEGDVSKAERAILVFDEFDKLGEAQLDTKKDLIPIFLKVFEGGSFPISRQSKQTRIYNTGMASKVALGVFADAFQKEKHIGFYASTLEEEVFDQKLLSKKGYFTDELLTRIQHFIPYQSLTEEDKKRIILESRLSTYLLKKDRFRNQFGIEIIGDEDYATSVLETLKKEDKSVRDINNIIDTSFLDVEFDVLAFPGKYKVLQLTRDTVSKGRYDLY